MGWSFQFEDASKRAGVCVFGLKVIGLSRLYCLHATGPQVRDTILHEIAQALVGPKHNHDATWKAVARSVGCTGDRCHKVEFAPPRYIARSITYGWAVKRNVRKRGTICRDSLLAPTLRIFGSADSPQDIFQRGEPW